MASPGSKTPQTESESVMQLNVKGRLLIVLVAFALATFSSAATVRADETTTTYNQDGFSGVTKTTTDANTNTTTSVTTASSAVGGELCERTVKTTSIGKPVTSVKTVTTDVCYVLDTNGHKGKKLRTETTTVNNSNYNDAGGFTQTRDLKIELPSGNVIYHDDNTCDASGAIISGSRTVTYFFVPSGLKYVTARRRTRRNRPTRAARGRTSHSRRSR